MQMMKMLVRDFIDVSSKSAVSSLSVYKGEVSAPSRPRGRLPSLPGRSSARRGSLLIRPDEQERRAASLIYQIRLLPLELLLGSRLGDSGDAQSRRDQGV